MWSLLIDDRLKYMVLILQDQLAEKCITNVSWFESQNASYFVLNSQKNKNNDE